MAYETGTVTGTLLKFDGTPHRGTVRIIPNADEVLDADGNKILVGTLSVPLDADGKFSIVLPASDDLTLNPSGVTFSVRVALRGATSLRIDGVFIAADVTKDIADLVSVDPVAPSYQEWVNAAETAAGEAEAAQAAAETAKVDAETAATTATSSATTATNAATTAAASADAALASEVAAEAAVVAAEAAVEGVDAAIEQALEDHTPGISLGAVKRSTSFTTTNTNASSTSGDIPLFVLPITGQGRPIDLKFHCPAAWHSTASQLASVAIVCDGDINNANSQRDGVISPSASIGGGKCFTHTTDVLTLGVVYTFTVRIYNAVAGTNTSTWFANAAYKLEFSAKSR